MKLLKSKHPASEASGTWPKNTNANCAEEENSYHEIHTGPVVRLAVHSFACCGTGCKNSITARMDRWPAMTSPTKFYSGTASKSLSAHLGLRKPAN